MIMNNTSVSISIAFFGSGTLCGTIGFFLMKKKIEQLKKWVKVKGVIADEKINVNSSFPTMSNTESYSSSGEFFSTIDSGDSYTFYPIATYTTLKGKNIVGVSLTGFARQKHFKGDTIELYYNPANNKEFIMQGGDKTLELIFGGLGILFLISGVYLFLTT